MMPLRPATTLWPPVLLGSQFVFNIGFYAVVPFLAIFLRDDMLLSGGLIGLILGLRTFSQQGCSSSAVRSQTALVPKSLSSAAASFALRGICCWHLDTRSGPSSLAPV
ncbi:major facilitator transporter [Enterobacter cloacae]|uniref:Major facilitator transporter n=1 Tax=Enterobacter cloacae TaxID=550 RepID=A0A377LV04_ENTCL|nr:major facilitator transporter [Enterobacter cloacae]